ncbi:MAG: hypothetical protein ACJATW_001201 [Glaciecola sp.]|jgi:hypothetical protein
MSKTRGDAALIIAGPVRLIDESKYTSAIESPPPAEQKIRLREG